LFEALYAGRCQVPVLTPFPDLFESKLTQLYETYGISVEVWDQKALTNSLGWSDADVEALRQQGVKIAPVAQPQVAQPQVTQSVASLLPIGPSTLTLLLPWLLAQLLFLTRQTDFPSISELDQDLTAQSTLAATIAGLWDAVRGLIEIPAAVASPVTESSPRQRGAPTQQLNQSHSSGSGATPSPDAPQFSPSEPIEPINLRVRVFEPQQFTDSTDSNISSEFIPVDPAPEVIQSDLLTDPANPIITPTDNTPSSNSSGNISDDVTDQPVTDQPKPYYPPISIPNPFAINIASFVSQIIGQSEPTVPPVVIPPDTTSTGNTQPEISPSNNPPTDSSTPPTSNPPTGSSQTNNPPTDTSPTNNSLTNNPPTGSSPIDTPATDIKSG
jgi:hypothetical protein